MAFMTLRLFKSQVLISINRVQKESISNKLDQPNWTNINKNSKIRSPFNLIKKIRATSMLSQQHPLATDITVAENQSKKGHFHLNWSFSAENDRFQTELRKLL